MAEDAAVLDHRHLQLTGLGMEVYVPTAEEVAAFREIAQPAVREHLESAVGEDWVSKLVAAVEQAGAQ